MQIRIPHPDLASMAIRAIAQPGELAVLRELEEAYNRSYDKRNVHLSTDDPEFARKERLLGALERLAAHYGTRIPATLWEHLADTVASSPLGTKKVVVPTAHATRADRIRDVIEHALKNTPELLLHVNTEFSKAGGVVWIHMCNCSDCFVPGTVDVSILPERTLEVARDFLANALTEGPRILDDGRPYAFFQDAAAETNIAAH